VTLIHIFWGEYDLFQNDLGSFAGALGHPYPTLFHKYLCRISTQFYTGQEVEIPISLKSHLVSYLGQ
jgi:hypothetical protein